MKLPLLPAVIILLPNCNIRPFTYTSVKGNTTKSLGMSVLTKAQQSVASITSPDGETISFSETGKDETTGAISIARTYGTIKVADFLKQRENAKTNASASVEKASIKSQTDQAAIAADVEKARTAAEVQKEAIGAGVETIPTSVTP